MGSAGHWDFANDQRLTTNDMFVDSHAHLDGKQFDSDREAVIARAREAGVQAIVAIGNGDGPAVIYQDVVPTGDARLMGGA